MKILKHGKVEMRKLVCPSCGCIFIASDADFEYDSYGKLAICPQEGCERKFIVHLDDGEPYEEPTQEDSRLKLIFLIKNFRATNLETADCEADFLIANGVRVEEDT